MSFNRQFIKPVPRHMGSIREQCHIIALGACISALTHHVVGQIEVAQSRCLLSQGGDLLERIEPVAGQTEAGQLKAHGRLTALGSRWVWGMRHVGVARYLKSRCDTYRDT